MSAVPPAAAAAAAPALALALPAYDEEEVIEATLRDLAAAFVDVPVRIVVVDNASRDATGRIIDALVAEGLPVQKIRLDDNRGYGRGVRAGLAACDAPWVGFLCADGQVAAADVRALYERARALPHPALVKVRRRFRKDGADRKVVSVLYNLAANLLHGGLGSIDLNGNPKLLPADALAAMDLRADDWLLDLEVMRAARAAGLPVVEVDVEARARGGGRSHVRPGTVLTFAGAMLAARLGAR